jgi:hypothetical protein
MFLKINIGGKKDKGVQERKTEIFIECDKISSDKVIRAKFFRLLVKYSISTNLENH